MTDDAPEEILSALLEYSRDIIVVVDETGHITFVSPAIREILGYDQVEISGELVTDYVHPSDREDVRNRFLDLLERPGDSTERFTHRFEHADGDWVWLETVGSNRADTALDGFVFNSREITDRREREAELRRMKRAVDASGHAIYITDPAAHIEYVNPAFEEITGYSAEEAIGKTPRILKSGEMEEGYYEELWDTLLSGSEWEEEVINRRKSGELYTAHQTISPITNGSSEVQAFVAIQTDITERKELHQRLSVVNRILRHDIRSAVSVIRGNARLAKSSETETDEVLETIQAEAERLYGLSENARHVEEVLSGTGPRTEEVDLRPLVEAKLLRLQNSHPSVSVEYDLPESAVVEASVRLEEALENVLENAIEHNDRPEPTLSVQVREADDEWVEIRVADDGPGIPADELEPLEAGIETALEHTSGLGLWVVAWVLEESGGELAFEMNEPRGTVVIMRLPPGDQTA